jgi:hypothetical protein
MVCRRVTRVWQAVCPLLYDEVDNNSFQMLLLGIDTTLGLLSDAECVHRLIYRLICK